MKELAILLFLAYWGYGIYAVGKKSTAEKKNYFALAMVALFWPFYLIKK